MVLIRSDDVPAPPATHAVLDAKRAAMEIQQIRYFLAICEDRNFTRAAKRCGIAQPSLTMAIKRLEATCGGPLFYREAKGVRPTQLAVILRPHFKRIIRNVEQAEAEASKFLKNNLNGTDQPSPGPMFIIPAQLK